MVLQGAPRFGGDAAPCARDNCLERDLPQRAANPAKPVCRLVAEVPHHVQPGYARSRGHPRRASGSLCLAPEARCPWSDQRDLPAPVGARCTPGTELVCAPKAKLRSIRVLESLPLRGLVPESFNAERPARFAGWLPLKERWCPSQ